MTKSTKREDGLSLHTTFRLPRDLHERLTKASGEGGIGEEIRKRLERSFTPGPSDDPKTRQLLAAISHMVSTLSFDGEWHDDPYLFQVLRAGVLMLLSRFQPPGDPAQRRHPEGSYVMFDPEQDPPETAGRMLAVMAVQYTTRE